MSDKEIEVQRHGIMFLLSSAGITLIGFLATMFYAHWVGPGVLGIYFVFLSGLAILSFFSDFGIGSAATQRISSGIDQNELFTVSLTIRMILYGIVCLVILVFGQYFTELNNSGLLLVLLIVFGISTFDACISIAIGASNRLGLSASVSLLNNVTRICVQVLAVFAGFQVYGLIGGLVAGLLVEIIIQLKYMDYHIKKFNWSHVKSIWSFSSWAFLSTFSTILFDNTNPLIIAFFMPISDVGIFGVCWTFSIFALFVSTALCNTLFVKVSRWRATGDWDAITIALSRATSYALVLAIPMLIGGAILGESLLYYLYGASFAAGATALVIIIAARIVQSVLQLYSNFLMATDHVKDQFFGLLAGIVVNIVLSLLLIPLWGLPGAAIASLANVSISTILCRHYLGMIIPIHVDINTIKDILISAGIMTVVILPISVLLDRTLLTTMILVCAGAGVYGIALLQRNGQIREDILNILKIRWI
ncbi:MAG: polysaccharide biosynthesis C-terminal domain-containing protein [Methanoregula sp.]|jgi:O-antigen/teichoic acid export membrane protein|uniref:oligosaccharide flippase family protein n=1 Tax=Methanoregula sp. TaxID=2052170 RepID=UPI003C227F79